MSITLELFWLLKRPFGSADEVTAVASMIASAPIEWTRYDQNMMRSWRPFNEERFVVDAQTQRTAMMRIEGEDGGMGLLALGKRGEPPTLIVRRDFEDGAEAEAYFLGALETGGTLIVRGGVAPKSARDAYMRSGHGLSAVGPLELSAWLSAVRPDEDPIASLEIVPKRTAHGFTIYQMLPGFDAEPDQAVDHWKELADKLAKRLT